MDQTSPAEPTGHPVRLMPVFAFPHFLTFWNSNTFLGHLLPSQPQIQPLLPGALALLSSNDSRHQGWGPGRAQCCWAINWLKPLCHQNEETHTHTESHTQISVCQPTCLAWGRTPASALLISTSSTPCFWETQSLTVRSRPSAMQCSLLTNHGLRR